MTRLALISLGFFLGSILQADAGCGLFARHRAAKQARRQASCQAQGQCQSANTLLSYQPPLVQVPVPAPTPQVVPVSPPVPAKTP